MKRDADVEAKAISSSGRQLDAPSYAEVILAQ